MVEEKLGRSATCYEAETFSYIHLLLKVFLFEIFIITLQVRVLRTKVQVGVHFDEKYFYGNKQQRWFYCQ